MPVLKRLTNLLHANVNELIDRMESPDVLLKQAVRDLETKLESSQAAAAKVLAHEILLAKQLAELDEQIRQWQQCAVAAVARGDETVARQLIAEKLTGERTRRTLAQHHAEVAAAAGKLKRQIAALRGRVADTRRQQTLLEARWNVARTQLQRECPPSESHDNVLNRFARMRRKIEWIEAESAALAELSVGDSPVDHGDTPEADTIAIEAELRTLRQTVAATGTDSISKSTRVVTP